MMVNEKNTVVAKEHVILPGDHLSKAQYTNVVERQLLDGKSDEEKIKVCVSRNVELKKCKALSDTAFSRDVRPSLECVLKDKEKCIEALNEGAIEVVIVQADSFESLNLKDAKSILYEEIDGDDKYVVVADDTIQSNEIKKAEM